MFIFHRSIDSIRFSGFSNQTQTSIDPTSDCHSRHCCPWQLFLPFPGNCCRCHRYPAPRQQLRAWRWHSHANCQGREPGHGPVTAYVNNVCDWGGELNPNHRWNHLPSRGRAWPRSRTCSPISYYMTHGNHSKRPMHVTRAAVCNV